MPGIQEFRTNCDGDSIVETTHSPGLHDDTECNMDFLGTSYDKYTPKKFMYPQIRWMQPGIYKKRKSFKNKRLTAVHSPPWWNFGNKLNKLSIGSLSYCKSDEQYPECTRLSSLEMKRAVGLVYPYSIDDNNQNKRKLRSTTNFRDGKIPKELTTVYKRECDMTSLSTSDSGTISSSVKVQREIFKQVHSVNMQRNIPVNPDNIVQCYLVDKISPLKKDNTGYFEVVSRSDDFARNKKIQKHSFYGKRKEHKKEKNQYSTTTVTTPVSEGTKDKKSHKSKNDKLLTPIIEQNLEQASAEITNTVSTKSYHSIIRKKKTSYPNTTNDSNCLVSQFNSNPIKEAFHKEEVKRVSFLELDKYPTKINKDVDTKHFIRTTMKDQSQGTGAGLKCTQNIKMEDKSLSVHISGSSQEGKLSRSITKILNELLLDPKHEKVIKKVLYKLSHRADLRKSLSNTIFELKGKEKSGLSKRKSSGSIQNVSSSDLDRLHFEKYKASVDVAIKMLEDRMTKKIYDAIGIKEHRRKRKEDQGKYYRDIITYSGDKEYVKKKSCRSKYSIEENKSSVDIVTIDENLEEQYSIPSFKDKAGRLYQKENLRTTLAYNCYFNPSNTSPFKKNQEQSNNTNNTHPRRSAFSIPGQIDLYQAQNNTSNPTNIPNDDSSNNFQYMGEGSQSYLVSSEQSIPFKEDDMQGSVSTIEQHTMDLKKTLSATKIANSSLELGSNDENFDEISEVKDNLLPPPAFTSGDMSNEDIADSKKSYARGFRDVKIYRHEKGRSEDRHPRERYHKEPLSDFRPAGSLSNESHCCRKKLRVRSEDDDDVHPRISLHKQSIHGNNSLGKHSHQDNYGNSSEERGITSSHSKKNTYFPQSDDGQDRLLSREESKENNNTPNNPNIAASKMSFYSGYPNKHRVPEELKMRYGPSHHSEIQFPKINNKNKDESFYTNCNRQEQSNIMDTSLCPSSVSVTVTPTTKQSPGVSKVHSLRICKAAEEIKIKKSQEFDEQKRPPRYNDYDKQGDFNENIAQETYYGYDWCVGSYPNCPRPPYDNFPYLNQIETRNYPSLPTSRNSLQDPVPYNYDFSGPIYSERIRYTCRVQGAENANIISFVIFLMLFIGLFQYLNIHINL